MKSRVTSVLAAYILSVSSPVGAEPFFMSLDDLMGSGGNSRVRGVSEDGSAIVGYDSNLDVFRWTQQQGMVNLGGGIVQDVSADGSAVVGEKSWKAFRWTQGEGTVFLGDLPGGATYSSARNVSADGSVVVGTSESALGYEAFRWENGVMSGLGDLPGGDFYSYAYSVSADGSVIVGTSGGTFGSEAILWENGVMSSLGYLPNGKSSHARAVSADGTVVAGISVDSTSGRNIAFRWTAENGMVALGDLPGGYFGSQASDVSGDGSIVVGNSYTGPSAPGMLEVFIWEADTGMRNLREVLVAEFSLDLTGWWLTGDAKISGDGYTIVGMGYDPSGNYSAWIAHIPEPATLSLLALGGLALLRRGR